MPNESPFDVNAEVVRVLEKIVEERPDGADIDGAVLLNRVLIEVVVEGATATL